MNELLTNDLFYQIGSLWLISNYRLKTMIIIVTVGI